jgi:hypothetical protein
MTAAGDGRLDWRDSVLYGVGDRATCEHLHPRRSDDFLLMLFHLAASTRFEELSSCSPLTLDLPALGIGNVPRVTPGESPSSSSLLVTCSAHALKEWSASAEELKASATTQARSRSRDTPRSANPDRGLARRLLKRVLQARCPDHYAGDHSLMRMSTTSAPRLSIRPSLTALRCMMTPALFCSQRSPPPPPNATPTRRSL